MEPSTDSGGDVQQQTIHYPFGGHTKVERWHTKRWGPWGWVGLNSSPLCDSSPLSPLWPRTVTRCQLLHQVEKRLQRRIRAGESPRLRPCRTLQVLACWHVHTLLETGQKMSGFTKQHGPGAAVGSFSGWKSALFKSSCGQRPVYLQETR